MSNASFRLAKLCHECQSLDGGLWERACKLMGDLNRFANQAKRA